MFLKNELRWLPTSSNRLFHMSEAIFFNFSDKKLMTNDGLTLALCTGAFFNERAPSLVVPQVIWNKMKFVLNSNFLLITRLILLPIRVQTWIDVYGTNTWYMNLLFLSCKMMIYAVKIQRCLRVLLYCQGGIDLYAVKIQRCLLVLLLSGWHPTMSIFWLKGYRVKKADSTVSQFLYEYNE